MASSPATGIADMLAERVRTAGMTILPSLTALCAEFGVSYSTMRQAVKTLEKRGLVACRKGARTRVVPSSKKKSTIAAQAHTAAAHIAGHIGHGIAEATFRAGNQLPKAAFFVHTFRVSYSTVAEALRILDAQGLIHKRGARWYAGARPSVSEVPDISPGPARDPAVIVTVNMQENWRWMYQGYDSAVRGPFMRMFQNEAGKFGLRLSMVTTHDLGDTVPIPSGREQIRAYITSLGARFRGIMILPWGTSLHDEETVAWIRVLSRPGLPVVAYTPVQKRGPFLDRRTVGMHTTFFHCIFDEAESVRLAHDTLYRYGHRRIGMPRHTLPVLAFVDRRLRNLRAAARRRNRESVIVAGPPGTEFTPHTYRTINTLKSVVDSARFATEQRENKVFSVLSLLGKGEVTAITAPNDRLAFYYYLWLTGTGVRIPHDVSMISFDNREEFQMFPVSSIDHGLSVLGYKAAHLFIGDFAVHTDDRYGTLRARPVLFDRGSIGPPARAAGQ